MEEARESGTAQSSVRFVRRGYQLNRIVGHASITASISERPQPPSDTKWFYLDADTSTFRNATRALFDADT